MPFVTIGINHNTAPVSLREKVAFTPDKLMQALNHFAKNDQDDEVVILSTCNRTEIYLSSETIQSKKVVDWLSVFHELGNANELSNYLYEHQHDGSVIHLMRVASGLDSLVLGEPQILGQVKQAFSEAKRAGTVGPMFERLFQSTFAVAKQVRTDTDIGASAVSVAFAAVQLSKQIFGKLSKCHCLLVGAGETIELVGQHLSESNIASITVANRTLENAERVATKYGGEAISITQVPSHLSDSDIVISSTASALPIIGAGMVNTALKRRKQKPMLLIDLAVPRDIETEVDELDEAYLYSVDDLQDIVASNIANREQAADQANGIIAAKSEEFIQRLQQEQHVDLIKTYRTEAQANADELLKKTLLSLQQGGEPEALLNEFNNKLTKQLMHGPTKALQEAIRRGDQEIMSVLKSTLLSNK
ncbi:MAG: glutamyl-tRNA reductase [Pseudomonadota bacterium]